MKELFSIFFTFCKVGLFTVGGGYSMLPIIQRYIVEDKKWISEEEVLDFYAIGQCLPGMISVNTATFIGERIKGRMGGIAAGFGVTFPSFLVIAVIAAFIQNFVEIEAVQNAFYGIRIAVAALIVDAIIKLWKKGMKDFWCYLLFVLVVVFSVFLKVSTILLILGSVFLGILIKTIENKKEGAK